MFQSGPHVLHCLWKGRDQQGDLRGWSLPVCAPCPFPVGFLAGFPAHGYGTSFSGAARMKDSSTDPSHLGTPVGVAFFSSMPRYKWYVIGMLWWISFFNYADRQAIFSVFSLLEAEMGLTKVELGLLGSSFAWVYGLGAPFAGGIVD